MQRIWIAVAVGMLMTLSAFGQPGAVDREFQPDLRANEIPVDLAVQPDGSIYVMLDPELSAKHRLPRVVRLRADGQRDESFRPEPFPDLKWYRFEQIYVDGSDQVYVLAKRLKISGAVLPPPEPPHPILSRLRPDGGADPGFRIEDSLGQTLEFCKGSKDGGVWAVASLPGENASSLLKIGNDGSIAARLVDVPQGQWFQVRGLHERTHGRLLVSGLIRTPALPNRHGLAQFLPDGTLDPDFIPDVILPPRDAVPPISSSALLPDDRLVVGGKFPSVGNFRTTNVARFLPNGRIDTRFHAPPMDDGVSRVYAEPDGHVVVFGYFRRIAGLMRPAVARLKPDGQLDSDFSLSLPENARPRAYAQAPDGSLYVAGDGVPQPDGRGFLVRIQRQGTGKERPEIVTSPVGANRRVGGEAALEPVVRCGPGATFQWFQNGEPLPGATQSFLRFPDLHLFHNGTYVLRVSDESGSAETLPVAVVVEPTLARAGWPDLTYRCVVGSEGGRAPSISALLRLPAGRLLAGGEFKSIGQTNTGSLVVLEPSGLVNLKLTQPLHTFGSVSCLVAQTNGCILVGGRFAQIGGQSRNGVARLLPNGTIDPGFTPEFDPFARVDAVAPLSDGGYLVTGVLLHDGEPKPDAFLKLRSDGRIDRSYPKAEFDGMGSARIGLLPSGRVYFSLAPLDGPGGQGHLRRLLPDGKLDPSFPVLDIYRGRLGKLHTCDDERVWVSSDYFGPSISIRDPAGQTGSLFAEIRPDGRIEGRTGIGVRQLQRGGIETMARDSVGRFLVGGSSLSRYIDDVEDTDFLTHTDGMIHAISTDDTGDLFIGGTFKTVWDVPRPALARVYGADRSAPYLIGPFRTEQGVRLELDTFEGWLYELETADELRASSWKTTTTFQGNGKRQSILDPNQSNPARFYRVRVRP